MITVENRQPIRARSAWRPADFATADAYSFTLTGRHFAAFDRALALNRDAGRGAEDVTARDFALDGIAGDIAAWRDEVLHGRGFIVLREFPRDRYSPDDLGMLFFGLGTHFGRAVSQSSMGDRLGHVIDVGGKDRRERAYRTSRELTLHTDRCDVVGMLCLQKAVSGGLSGYASAHTIYNEILATRPELLDPLFSGFRYHRRGEELPGEPVVTPYKVPVLSESAGELSTVFLRAYIEMAAKELGVPLAEREVAALDSFEEVGRRDDVTLRFMLEPGHAIFFNNCTLLHNRTSFEDDGCEGHQRHLLRLWLMLDGLRPLTADIHSYKGTRGILGHEGSSTYYRGHAI
ncbi:MAG TPA: TauD/TfdA family dioxygenase [Candidatus Acidoferrum sp.]|nr:TauD/TfdA family dioxygenase [Candidatus Acidoferrum sp.]